MKAVGMIETRGRIAAIEAADTALKSANVKLIKFRQITGGIVTIFLEGEVAAVTVAVENAKMRASPFSKFVITKVIPHPDKQIHQAIDELRVEKGRSSRKRKKKVIKKEIIE